MNPQKIIQDSVPLPVVGQPLVLYFYDHVTPLRCSPNFFLVKRDLKAFKKVFYPLSDRSVKNNFGTGCVANLIIPAGSIIHAEPNYGNFSSSMDQRKMRASCAKVVSMARCSDGLAVNKARSNQDPLFYYTSGQTAIPTSFSLNPVACSEGIHFFLNLHDAFDY